MRKKVAKRKENKEESSPAKESKKTTTRAKRVKASKPQSEPEYFEDKRNLVKEICVVNSFSHSILQFF